MRINLESGKESRMSITPARLRAAGAERRPLRSDLPAYDFSLIEPIGGRRISVCYRSMEPRGSEAHLEGVSIA